MTNQTVDGGDPSGDAEKPMELTAYELTTGVALEPEPADRERQWMDDTTDAFARRCLPLLMANQSGWIIRNPQKVRLRWNGKPDSGAIKIDYDGDPPPYPVTTDFGFGIVSWRLPHLYRTPPGYNLLVRGPANFPKDGIQALEGLVETDWSVSTFTMNWKITRPKHWVTFEAGDPICQLVPTRRGELESFRPAIVPIDDAPEVKAGFYEFREKRLAFRKALMDHDPEAVAEGWQRDYVRGRTPSGERAPEHQTKLQLQPFTEAPPSGAPTGDDR